MILVFGSIFMDVCFPVDHFPVRDGVSVAAPVRMTCGGKGANQAAAVNRTGAKAYLISKVGDDLFGEQLVNRLRNMGVITSGIGRGEQATGVVGVIIEPDGINTQIASPGANREATHDQIPDEVLKPGVFVMTGLSLPGPQVRALLTRARAHGCTTVLNVSPIKSYMHEVAPMADILMVNHDELMALGAQLGLTATTPDEMVAAIVDATGSDVVATLGGAGVIARRAGGDVYNLPVFPVENVVDTNGAGDCFAGFFVGGISSGMPWDAALKRANVAAALSCQTVGAFETYPYIDDVDAALQNCG